MSAIEVKVPDIGDFKEVEVIEVLVKVGDTIKVDQSLVTVESDKASMEIPASHAGVIKELKVKLGDKIAEGSILLVIEAEGAVGTAQRVQHLRLQQLRVAPAPAAVAAPAAPPAPTGQSASSKLKCRTSAISKKLKSSKSWSKWAIRSRSISL
jgi:pyruvate/2-oxoglutarate dehydrogenase complex dihydrolipoamide acyltransferase (E2) component